ncbi:MAG: ATP-dependent Clp protease ATP-binding subunit [Candidatus Pacebacteria bacterium]|nr:ATP-dependent Clp protease ATP-binding subunit [Candidatus Paceibacterota bacterium]
MAQENLSLFFADPRMRMTSAGRMLVRVVVFSIYIIGVTACVLFLLSDLPWLFWSGMMLLIFLLDILKHFGHADKSLQQKRLTGNVNLANYFTPSALGILEYAYERTMLFGGDFYLFLLKRLVDRKDVRIGLERMDLEPEKVSEKISEMLKESLKKEKAIDKKAQKELLLSETDKIAALSLQQAFGVHGRFIEPKDIFAALSYCESQSVATVLQFFNIAPGDLENTLIFSRYYIQFRWLKFLPATLGGFVRRPYKIRHRVMNRAWSARPTPFLDRFSEDLTDYARMERVGFLIGHRDEYDRIIDVLSRMGRPNVILVGEPGAGKDTLVAHLAYKIVKDEVPAELFDKRLVSLQIGNIIAGAEQNEIQERLKKIIDEIIQAGNIILFISDIHNLVKASGKDSFNIVNMLLPAIRSDSFSVIGLTTPEEYRRSIEPQAEFAKSFDVVKVQEISVEDATKLLVYDGIILERQYGITVTYSAVKQAVQLASKYFKEKLLPGSAQELLREALADVREKRVRILTADDVIDIAQRRINIPLRQAGEVEAEKLLNLEETIHERLIDQEEAVKAVSRSLREYRSGLARKGGPIAAFLFVGPTGVGKTELSKILAGIQFGSKEAMVRFDMTEYQDKQSVFRFIGSPDGTMRGSLTDAISQKPYSLVLLDEFEKAHPDILNLFLQVFDDGRLTDNFGQTVDFKNTIIIATSNAHSELIKKEIEAGKPMAVISEELKKRLTEYFKPELINRFSDIIVFKNLSPADTLAIAKISIKDLGKEVKASHGIILEISDDAAQKIAEWGYDPVFGARPLRGVISEKVRSVMAEKILKNEITRGSKVVIKLENNELAFYVG